MRAVIQRVSRASVIINRRETRSIGGGLLVLIGVGLTDGEEDIRWLVRKITAMRIFSDDLGKMNLSVLDTGGDILVVSQFTLFASTKRGNRPGFSFSAPPGRAIPLYKEFLAQLSAQLGKPVSAGEFGAQMDVDIQNIGPVTIILDSRNRQ